jgi:hypothetical protein
MFAAAVSLAKIRKLALKASYVQYDTTAIR